MEKTLFQFGVGKFIEDSLHDNNIIEKKKNEITTNYKKNNLNCYRDIAKSYKSIVWQLSSSPNGVYLCVLLTSTLLIYDISENSLTSLIGSAALPFDEQLDPLMRRINWTLNSKIILSTKY